MKIAIIGATGFIGRELAKKLANHGHEVVALSRNPVKAQGLFPDTLSIKAWDGKSADVLALALEGTDAVVNLAGETKANLEPGQYGPISHRSYFKDG